MTMYFEGHQQAQNELKAMSKNELLEVLDYLYGRNCLPEDFDLDELRREASRQVRQDFKNPEYQDHEQVEFWEKVMEATRNSGC